MIIALQCCAEFCRTTWISHKSTYSPSFFFFSFIFISWRLISLQYCSGFCYTLTWISHGFTYIPHPDPPSHLPLYPIPLGFPSAPGPSTCLMHPTCSSSFLSLPIPTPYLTPLGHHRAQGWAPCVIWKLPTRYLLHMIVYIC